MNNNKLELINRRERQLLVLSCAYYRYNETLVSDGEYDKRSFELAGLIKNYPNEFKKSVYYNEFENFDPSSGYYLNYTLMDSVACSLIKNK